MLKNFSNQVKQKVIMDNIPLALKGDEEAFIQILNASKITIESIINKYRSYDLSEELLKDLTQDAHYYLWSSVIPKYQSEKEAFFTTYLHQQLRGYLQSIYTKKYKMISFPSSFKREVKKIKNKPLRYRNIKENSKLKIFNNINNNNFQFEGNMINEHSYSFEEDKKVDILTYKDVFKSNTTQFEQKIFKLILEGNSIKDIGILLGKSRQYVNRIYNNSLIKLEKLGGVI